MYRSKTLLEVVRQCPCQGCGSQDGTVVAAHSNQLQDGKGRSLKAHDYRVAALCYNCHYAIDQGSRMTADERVKFWEDAHRKTIGWLFENGYITVNRLPRL